MSDPRIHKLAQVLVHYSLGLQPDDTLALRTSPLAQELSLAVYKEALSAGAHVYLANEIPGAREVFLKNASDAQLDYISPMDRMIVEQFKAIQDIDAYYNTRELSGIDPARMKRRSKARAPLFNKFLERLGNKELKWCFTVFPNHASAQEADMSLSDYEDFVYGAGLLDLPDPVAAWKEEGQRQQRQITWLDGKDLVTIQGDNVDLRLSIRGRTFQQACGHENFPDGEIYTSPVEESVDGWIRFSYPAIYAGREVIDIELWFEGGKIVREKASKGQELLTELLNTDDGARYLGELGIGTNYAIQRFTKDMLFDEKIGGTIHLAVGAGFPEAGSKNESGIHWDMLCNMANSEMRADGELFYKDGKFISAS
jgi:aminopeptidase